jgi:hypothetical protein
VSNDHLTKLLGQVWDQGRGLAVLGHGGEDLRAHLCHHYHLASQRFGERQKKVRQSLHFNFFIGPSSALMSKSYLFLNTRL